MANGHTKRVRILSLLLSTVLTSPVKAGISEIQTKGNTNDEQNKLETNLHYVSSGVRLSKSQLGHIEHQFSTNVLRHSKQKKEKLLEDSAQRASHKNTEMISHLPSAPDNHIDMNAHEHESNLTIVGTMWAAVQFAVNSNATNSDIFQLRDVLEVSGHPITLIFESENHITGYAGCNHYFSAAKLSSTALEIGDIATTRVYCNEDGIMEQESEYVHLLNNGAFIYNVFEGSAGEDEDELVLKQVITEDEEEIDGQVLACYVRATADKEMIQ